METRRDEGMKEEKKKLRAHLRTLRRSLSQAAVEEKSRLIFVRLSTSALFCQAKTIVLYSADENEVQTQAIWEEMVRQNKVGYYPRISADKANLQFVRRFPDEQLVPGAFGIFIPSGNELLTGLSETDIVLTPGVGFDLHGHRLGRGKGYYDRAFRGVLAGALRIALAYESQIVPTVPTEENDESVHFILTETRLIHC